MQNEKKDFGTMLRNFAEGKGFYIILALCAVAIGVSGYVLFFTGDGMETNIEDIEFSAGEYEDVDQPSYDIPQTPVDIFEDDSDNDPDSEQVNAPIDADNPDEEDDVPPDKEAVSTANPVNIEKDEGFASPVSGEVLRPFSAGELIYDQTMGDWRTHNGVDYACEEGAQVCAIGAGEVTGVYRDELLGNCVEITHANDVVSYYYGLGENTTLHEGMTLAKGDVIGGVGNTNITEIAEPSHVHLEVKQDGAYIDPVSLFETEGQ